MKLYTPEGDDLMQVTVIERDGDKLLIKGKIMGAMPMKAHLRPEDLRGIFKVASWKTLFFAFSLFFRRSVSGRSKVKTKH